MSRSEAVVQPEVAVPRDLVVSGLRVALEKHGESVPIIDGADFSIRAGRRLGLVGESGSGKSVSATAMMGLSDYPLSSNATRMTVGPVDLLKLSDEQWRDVRGPVIALIQQDPLTALTPVFTVGSQVAEPIRRHLGLSKRDAWNEAVERLDEVGIPDPRSRMLDYPHQLSGGLRQRVAIAVALAARPSIVFADEPTTALDVTVQAQIIDLMRELSDRQDTSIMFITHDLGLLPGFVHDVSVMYSGRIVETGESQLVLAEPRHPYTAALVAAQPGNAPAAPKRRLATVPGSPPVPDARPQGCAFAPRCPLAIQRCREVEPQLRLVDGRDVACHRAEEVRLKRVAS